MEAQTAGVFCTRCGHKASSLEARFCSRCGGALLQRDEAARRGVPAHPEGRSTPAQPATLQRQQAHGPRPDLPEHVPPELHTTRPWDAPGGILSRPHTAPLAADGSRALPPLPPPADTAGGAHGPSLPAVGSMPSLPSADAQGEGTTSLPGGDDRLAALPPSVAALFRELGDTSSGSAPVRMPEPHRPTSMVTTYLLPPLFLPDANVPEPEIVPYAPEPKFERRSAAIASQAAAPTGDLDAVAQGPEHDTVSSAPDREIDRDKPSADLEVALDREIERSIPSDAPDTASADALPQGTELGSMAPDVVALATPIASAATGVPAADSLTAVAGTASAAPAAMHDLDSPAHAAGPPAALRTGDDPAPVAPGDPDVASVPAGSTDPGPADVNGPEPHDHAGGDPRSSTPYPPSTPEIDAQPPPPFPEPSAHEVDADPPVEAIDVPLPPAVDQPTAEIDALPLSLLPKLPAPEIAMPPLPARAEPAADELDALAPLPEAAVPYTEIEPSAPSPIADRPANEPEFLEQFPDLHEPPTPEAAQPVGHSPFGIRYDDGPQPEAPVQPEAPPTAPRPDAPGPWPAPVAWPEPGIARAGCRIARVGADAGWLEIALDADACLVCAVSALLWLDPALGAEPIAAADFACAASGPADAGGFLSLTGPGSLCLGASHGGSLALLPLQAGGAIEVARGAQLVARGAGLVAERRAPRGSAVAARYRAVQPALAILEVPGVPYTATLPLSNTLVAGDGILVAADAGVLATPVRQPLPAQRIFGPGALLLRGGRPE